MSPDFQHLAWTIARVVAGLLGLTFLYMALFMYQDERGRMQNRLVNLWLAAQAHEESALNVQLGLIRDSSRLATSGLQSLFGTRLFSARAASISFSLSISSGLMVMSTSGLFGRSLSSFAAAVIFGAYGFFFGPHLFNRGRNKLAVLILALLCLFFYAGAYLGLAKFNFDALVDAIQSDGIIFPVMLVVSCLFGLVCDLLLLAVNRRILEAMSRTSSAGLFVAGIVYNLFWALILADSIRFILSWDRILGHGNWHDPMALAARHLLREGSLNINSLIFILGAFSTNLFTVLTASSVVLILMVAVVHRFTWPVVGRTLNALYEWEIMSSRKLQFSAATGFLLFSIPRLSTLFTHSK